MTLPSEDDAVLKGMRILVVEDSFLIAWSLRRMLTELGCRVVGPVSTVAQALQVINEDGCDAAILDVNLGDETSIPVAQALVGREKPFFFVTGYSSPAVAAMLQFKSHRRLRKPLTDVMLRDAMLNEFVRQT